MRHPPPQRGRHRLDYGIVSGHEGQQARPALPRAGLPRKQRVACVGSMRRGEGRGGWLCLGGRARGWEFAGAGSRGS